MKGAEIATMLFGAVGALGGLGAFLTSIFGRRKQKAEAGRHEAEATQIITGTAMSLVNELEEDAKAARAEAKQAREEMRALAGEARLLADELHALRTAIMRPDASLEALRLLVSGTGSNGRGR